MTTLVLPVFYLPPIDYIAQWRQQNAKEHLLEKWEHYPKQTYRNRASIYSANGKLDLIIPVQKGRGMHTVMKDVKINYESDWQRLHWMSLQTCYRKSAYFEYYEDDFAPFYETKHTFLLDFNLGLLDLVFRKLKWPVEYGLTESYRDYEASENFRSTFSAKKADTGLKRKPYMQVFEDRHGFLENLSIVDLLFNQGPASTAYL